MILHKSLVLSRTKTSIKARKKHFCSLMKYDHPKEDEYSYLGHQHVKDYGKRDSKYDKIYESR